MSIKKIYDILLSPVVPCMRQEDIRLSTSLILFKRTTLSEGELNAGLDGWDDRIPEFQMYHLETYHLFQSDKASYASA